MEVGDGKYSFGIIDGSLQSKKCGKSISEEHIGCEVGNLLNFQSSILRIVIFCLFIMANILVIIIAFIQRNESFEFSFSYNEKMKNDLVSWLLEGYSWGIIIISIIFICFIVRFKKNLKKLKVYNKEYKKLGILNYIYNKHYFTMEIDLRSDNSEKRTLHFFINNSQQRIFFYGLPSCVQFGVCFLFSSLLYFIVKMI